MDCITEYSLQHSPDKFCKPSEVKITKDPDLSDKIVEVVTEVLNSLPDDVPPCPREIHLELRNHFAASPSSYYSGVGKLSINYGVDIFEQIEEVSGELKDRINNYTCKVNALPDDPDTIADRVSKLSFKELHDVTRKDYPPIDFMSKNTAKVVMRHEIAHLIIQGNYQEANEKNNPTYQKIKEKYNQENFHLRILKTAIISISILFFASFNYQHDSFTDWSHFIFQQSVLSIGIIFLSFQLVHPWIDRLYPFSEEARFAFDNWYSLPLTHPKRLDKWKELDSPLVEYVEKEADQFALDHSTLEEIKEFRAYLKHGFIRDTACYTSNSLRLFRHIPLIQNLCWWGEYPKITKLNEGKHFELFARLRLLNERVKQLTHLKVVEQES